MTVAEILEQQDELSTQQVERELNERDQQVSEIRTEMKLIHAVWQKKSLADQAKTAGPTHLTQGVRF